MTSFEEILARDGVLVYKTRGTSMRPLLREGQDLVTIRTPEERLKALDIALYKRGEAFVLHRVIRVMDDHYLIRGDNTYTLETVPCEAVIGVLTGFKRGTREFPASAPFYRFYSRIWTVIYPLRHACFQLAGGLKAIARKLGLTPLLKK